MPENAKAEDYEPITLLDIVRVLHGRRVAFGIVMALSVVAGTTLTLFQVPVYEASGTVIPLQHGSIIAGWMASRQGAESVVEAMGDELAPALFPDRWQAQTGQWVGTPPSVAERVAALRGHVTVPPRAGEQANIVLVASFSDPAIAARVAAEYLGSLDDLRPHLEALTRGALFEKYYDGTNAQEAHARAETSAAQATYWLVFDTPTVPSSPVSPRPVANLAIAAITGLILGAAVVFLLEWLSRYRADFARVGLPPR